MSLGFRVEKGLPKKLRGLTRGGGPPWLGNFVAKNSLSSKILELKKFLGTRNCSEKKSKIFLSSEILELKKFWGNNKLFRKKNKIFLSSEILELKKFLGNKKLFRKKSLSSKILELENFLGNKKLFGKNTKNFSPPAAGLEGEFRV